MFNAEICNKCNTELVWAESARQVYDHNIGDYYEIYEDVQYCEKCEYGQFEEE